MKVKIALEDLENGNLNVKTLLLATEDELTRGEFDTPARQLLQHLEHEIRAWTDANRLTSIKTHAYPDHNDTLKH